MSWETFTPEAHGLHLQRGYPIEPTFQVEEDERELGNITSVAVADKPRRVLRMRWVADTRAASEYVISFFLRHKGSAGRFYYAWPEFVPSPDAAPTLEAVVSGAQAERTVTARIAWKNSAGRTLASPVGTLLIPANNLVKITVPVYPPSVSECVIYASDTGGTPQQQTILAGPLTWTQPDALLLLATADPPTANTATETPLMKAVGEPPYRITRGIGTTYEITMDLEEVYHA
jgi:hypothetical protein